MLAEKRFNAIFHSAELPLKLPRRELEPRLDRLLEMLSRIPDLEGVQT